MPIIADRVRETSTTSGTGTITLAGAVTGYQSFATALGSSSTSVPYCIVDNTAATWEVGLGTFNGTTSLSRDTVTASSNAGALVNFAANSKDVFLDASATVVHHSNLGYVLATASGMAMP